MESLLIGYLVYPKKTSWLDNRTGGTMGFIKNVFTVFDYLVNPSEYKDKGATGERFTFRELKSHFPKKYILRNVYLKKKDGKLTEIDLLLVTRAGIFVFESKNYSGWIFGNDKDSQWTQTFPNGAKTKFFSPIIQNKVHVDGLRHNLTEFPQMRYFSIIVFSDRCELKSISVDSIEDVYVIKRQNLIWTIKDIQSSHEDVINDSEKDKIIEMLSSASRPSDEVKKQHLNELEDVATQCPRCGRQLVERVNAKTNDVFYGCKGFPKCRYSAKTL